MKNKINTYISLFSSAGVGCYGFFQENFNCVATLELLEKRMAIQRYNSKCKYDSGYILGDIRDPGTRLRLNEEIKRWDLQGGHELDFLIATPPCQGMSVANHKKNNEIVRNSLVVESITITKNIMPKVFLYENVRSFLKTSCTDTDGSVKSIEDVLFQKLGSSYKIESRIVNFKDFGASSSRTRTLVIGVRNDISNISPKDLFPGYTKERSLYEVIGRLPSLKEMGEISNSDIYHSFRNYDPRMLNWISGLKEGMSAFENSDIRKIPHKVIDGKMVINANKNSDKYRRQFWSKVAPCVHTRNDILASQNTVHPIDDRVFSIRELMLMMDIPSDFKWIDRDFSELNLMSIDEKKEFLKKNELNIRHSIGEAVPTVIFRKIASNYKKTLNEK